MFERIILVANLDKKRKKKTFIPTPVHINALSSLAS